MHRSPVRETSLPPCSADEVGACEVADELQPPRVDGGAVVPVDVRRAVRQDIHGRRGEILELDGLLLGEERPVNLPGWDDVEGSRLDDLVVCAEPAVDQKQSLNRRVVVLGKLGPLLYARQLD